MKLKLKYVIAALICLGQSALQASVITFGGYSGAFPYTEDNLTVSTAQTPVDGNWMVTGAATIGTAASVSSPYATPSNPGSITVSGGCFYFSSVDLAAGPVAGQIYGPLSFAYSITGSLGGSTVFTSTASLATLANYSSVLWNSVTGDPLAMIDNLSITLSTTGTGGVSTVGYALKNLNVTFVPDAPITASLLGFSLTALALVRSRSPKK